MPSQLTAKRASHIRHCPSFNPMPSRFTEKFTDYLDGVKLKLARWQSGLYRESLNLPFAIAGVEGIADLPASPAPAPATPAAAPNGQAAQGQGTFVRIGERTPDGAQLYMNIDASSRTNTFTQAASDDAARSVARALERAGRMAEGEGLVSLSDELDMREILGNGKSRDVVISERVLAIEPPPLICPPITQVHGDLTQHLKQ